MCTGRTEKTVESRSAGTGPVFIVEPPSKVDFAINSRGVVIDCLVHGDPEPVVSWHDQHGRQIFDKSSTPSGLVRLLPNNSLSILPSTSGNTNGNHDHIMQASIYKCKAKNKYGTIVSRPALVNAGRYFINIIQTG